MRVTSLLLVVAAMTTLGHAANAVLALRGNDPVLLTQGRTAAGKADLTATYRGFEYRFTKTELRARFVADPARFGIQLDGECAFASDMKGDPEQYVVANGRIYLVTFAHCSAAFRANPGKYVDLATGQRRALTAEDRRRKVAILVFDGVQTLDVGGAFEVFAQAGMQPFTVAKTKKAITTLAGLPLNPSFDFNDCPIPEILVVPGGRVHDKDLEILNWLRGRAGTARQVMSVGKGALYLARAGMLGGVPATTSYDAIDELRELAPTARVSRSARYVDNGTVITAAGSAAVIDTALHVIEELDGLGRAQSVALHLEYDWRPSSRYARASLADRPIREMLGDTGFQVPPGRLRRWVLLSQEGDTRWWQRRWEADVDLAPDEVLAILNQKMAQRWSNLRTNMTAADGTSDWRWVDSDGIAWIGSARVQKTDPVASRYAITIRVERE